MKEEVKFGALMIFLLGGLVVSGIVADRWQNKQGDAPPISEERYCDRFSKYAIKDVLAKCVKYYN